MVALLVVDIARTMGFQKMAEPKWNTYTDAMREPGYREIVMDFSTMIDRIEMTIGPDQMRHLAGGRWQAFVEHRMEFAQDKLVLRILHDIPRVFLDQIDIDAVEDVQWPADWWQHFKERWFPKWALRRFPVRYTHRLGHPRKTIDASAYYPDFKIEGHDPWVRLHLQEDRPIGIEEKRSP